MRHLHEELHNNHHLKYNGREQFNLFLKGLGMTMQEALIYWRRAFAPKVPEDKFLKEYAYNIRYNFGQEGKRVDQNPWGCHTIIVSKHPSPGENHGCPFRAFSADNLRAKMRAFNVPDANISEILTLVQNQHYQIACTRYYEITHKAEVQIDIINHPNSYFDQSMGRAKASQATTTTQSGSSSSSSASS